MLSDEAEERAQKPVAVQFFLLAPYVAVEAVRHLVIGHEAETSVLGMVLTATSLIGMPFLGVAKRRLAATLGSSASHGEGAQNLLCAYLAGAVYLGLAGQRRARLVVAGSDRRALHRGRRRQGKARDLARRGLLRGAGDGHARGPPRRLLRLTSDLQQTDASYHVARHMLRRLPPTAAGEA